MENRPDSFLRRIIHKLGQRFVQNDNPSITRIKRRRAFTSLFTCHLSRLIIALLAAGHLWLLVLPSSFLDRWVYIDENALQPGQVSTYWNWGDVHAADKYLEDLERLRDSNATSDQRAHFLKNELSKLGLSSATQQYIFRSNKEDIVGTNAYAVLASPRGPRNEAIIIGASWLSRTGEGNGIVNLRGISTVLALARFLRNYSLWAKDLVFVISDGYLDGMHAWLNVYHGAQLSNLNAEPLELTSGVIWTALNLDYPGHSFSHLGLFFEGLNGRLPNQDLMNCVQRISRGTGGVPVTVYDHLEWRDPAASPSKFSSPLSPLLHNPGVRDFVHRAKIITRHIGYQAMGQTSGVHGLYHKFRIDAVTVFAVPATGPHGFHALGRIVESSLRTMNNLLERLHASFFFFILTAPDRFMKIGSYIPSVILISIAMMFQGLRCWVDAKWSSARLLKEKADDSHKNVSSTQIRPVLPALVIMFLTHLLGTAVFFAIRSPWFLNDQKLYAPAFMLVILVVSFTLSQIPYPFDRDSAPFWLVLKALNLCFASTVISTITVLNFSLAALLAVTLGLPLTFSCSSTSKLRSRLKGLLYVFLASGWLFFYQETQRAIWNWEILSVWFAPFVCLIYMPLVIQAGIVCALPYL